MSVKYDVVILGGGIAGSAAAYNIKLLRPESKIVVVDPLEYGDLKVSVVTFREHLVRYGLLDAVEYEYSSQRFETISRVGYSTSLNERSFALINYGKACKLLIERVGVERLMDQFESFDGETIHLKSGETITAEIIVDAMGLYSPLRDQLGLEKPDLRTVLLFGRFKTSPEYIRHDTFSYVVGNGVFDGFVSNGGWIYPCGEDEVEVGAAFLINDPDGKFEMTKKMREALEKSLNQILDSFFPDARRISDLHERVTAYSPTKHVRYGNILFLGDNAGTGDPFLCANCSRYMDMSEYLASAVAAALQSDILELEFYQESWNYELVHYCKRRLARAEILFRKSPKEWEKILRIRKNRSAKKTLATRMGKVGYSLKYTFQRYPLQDVIFLLGRELSFHMKFNVWNPKKTSSSFMEFLSRLQEMYANETPKPLEEEHENTIQTPVFVEET